MKIESIVRRDSSRSDFVKAVSIPEHALDASAGSFTVLAFRLDSMLRRSTRVALACLSLIGLATGLSAAEPAWPKLPEQNGAVEIPAQTWPLRPGARTVRVLVHFPGGKLANVTERTGLMLTLHNWGGTDCVGTASPTVLADRLNVVALCVNYLQSGPKDSIEGPEPYDFGYLQALDALRALWWLDHELRELKKPFAEGRIYATGGSGGGNVTLMCEKFAPRTFACVVDLCGMKKLSDDIAFHVPGGSDLNARYSRDPNSPNFLPLDRQELHFLGNPIHLQSRRSLQPTSKIVSVHGVDDVTCPYADAVEMVAWMKQSGVDIEPHFVTKEMIDGKVFASTGHSLGDRTGIVLQVAGKYLQPDSSESLIRKGPSDFARRDLIRFDTTNGSFMIDYSAGYPVSNFAINGPPPEYANHHVATYWRNHSGPDQEVNSQSAWTIRREHIRRHFERVTGRLPSPLRRVPLDVKVIDEVKVGALTRRKLNFQSDPDDRVTAYLFLPAPSDDQQRLPAVLCLQQTTNAGKDEPAGIRGDPNLKYALELAERGFVTFAPDYPSFGEHPYDFDPKHGYISGTMKAIWDNIRSVDYLQSLAEVDPERIGVIGHSLGGHNAIFTAVFEPRLKVIVSSCGFSSMTKDDVPSWTGPRYMPRIASEFQNDVNKLPFDFHELIASLAPRPFLASAATKDSDFDVTGVQDVIASAKPIYELYEKPDNVIGHYPEAGHSFPEPSRKLAYEFIERHLKQ